MQRFTFLSLVLVGLVFLISVENAYATHIPSITVTIDQNPALIENSLVVTVRDYALANNSIADTASVTFTDASGAPITTISNISEIEDTGVFVHKYVKFTQGSPGPNDIPASPDQPFTVTGTTSLGTSTPITVVVKSSIAQVWKQKIANSEAPATCDSSGLDDDGICDEWEKMESDPNHGLDITWPGPVAYHYPCDPFCPDRDINDIYVEIDHMDDHDPDLAAIEQVKQAFESIDKNSDGKPDFRLHVQVDEMALIHAPTTKFPGSNARFPSNAGFDQAKAQWSGSVIERDSNGDGQIDPDWLNFKWKSKKQAFHYVLFVHGYAGSPSSSGVAEIWGNDAMISLGSATGGIGSTDEQAGTFMHELGHNLKLDHGGPWNTDSSTVNCKPNYLSVMSYSRQFAGTFNTNRPLNYSGGALTNWPEPLPSPLQPHEIIGLDEDGLSNYEDNSQLIVYGPVPPAILPTPGGIDIDWNGDGGVSSGMVSADANNLPGCNSLGSSEALDGHDDWSNLDLKFTESGENSDGAPMPINLAATDAASQFNKIRVVAGSPDHSYQPGSGEPVIDYRMDEITKDIVVDYRILSITSLECFLNLNVNCSNPEMHINKQEFTDPDKSLQIPMQQDDLQNVKSEDTKATKDKSVNKKASTDLTDEELYVYDNSKSVEKAKKEILAKTTDIKESLSKALKESATSDVGLKDAIKQIEGLQENLKPILKDDAYRIFLKVSDDTISTYKIALKTQLPVIHEKDRISPVVCESNQDLVNGMCVKTTTSIQQEICSDMIDNDHDGLTDEGCLGPEGLIAQMVAIIVTAISIAAGMVSIRIRA